VACATTQTMRLGVARALVGSTVVPGDVVVEDGRIAALGASPAGPEGTAIPGFVDVQVNGFAGVDYLAGEADDWRRAADAMAATGVTAYRPTLITAAPADLHRALGVAGELVGGPGPRVLGVHLEGPFLSPSWPGAHPPELLRDPDVELLDELRAAGPVAHMTVAPERPGGLELVSSLVARGITVSVGHTDADADACHAAFDRGARALTHLHNAHRRFAARDPGPAGVALTRDDVTVTAIVDHVHLAPETAAMGWRAAGGRFALITDAIAAAGFGPGDWPLGERTVHVDERGEARLDDGRLAGSTLTMDAAVRNLIGLGASLEQAVHAAARAPALLAGRSELGLLAQGGPADLVVVDEELRVRRTLVAGVEVFGG
jgi:N-acetylglucosamine-6-phosphate deacetylase